MSALWLSFVSAVAGFGLISLTMQRHAHVISRRVPRLSGRSGKVVLRSFGAVALSASGVVALIDNPQLGVIHWSAILMAAVLLITGIHAYADR
jgi:hypothetical protein